MAVGERRYFPLAETVFGKDEVLVGVFSENLSRYYVTSAFSAVSAVVFIVSALVSGSWRLQASFFVAFMVSCLVCVISFALSMSMGGRKWFVSDSCIYLTRILELNVSIESHKLGKKIHFGRVLSMSARDSGGVDIKFISGDWLFLNIHEGQYIVMAFEAYKKSNARM